MDLDIEKETKTCIRSLLASSRKVMTAKKLQNDYRNLIGQDIPYQRMGYSTLEHFLNSIPDTCSVDGQGPNAAVLPVASEKSAYKTVTQPNVKRKIIQYPGQKPVLTTNNEKETSSKAVEEKTNPNLVKPDKKTAYDLSTIIGTPVKYVNGVPPPSTLSQTVAKSHISKPHRSAINKKNTTVPIKDSKHTKNDKTAKSSRSNIVVPECLEHELKDVISKFPDGIWCSDLPTYYREKYNKKLDYESLGFRRLIDLCLYLSKIFYCIQPGMCDYMLYDKRKPLPESVDKKDKFFDEVPEIEAEDSVSQLDWIDCSPLIPNDVCKLGHTISKQFVSERTKENDQIKIVLVEIYDPSKFWINLKNSYLDQMMNEIQIFYEAQKDEYLIPEFLLVDGLYCVQVIYNEYHRALIVDTMPDVKGKVKLLYIDYGTLTTASSEGICFLHKMFSVLPWQQIRCRLANIVPVEDGAPWPQETNKRFAQLINGRHLEAVIGSIDWEKKIIEVFLADVTDEKIFYINDVLVDEEFALTSNKERKKPKIKPSIRPIVKNLHLFPTFDELEYGLAPNARQMSYFNNNEVPLHFCIPQYFKSNHNDDVVIERNTRFIEKGVNEGLFSKPILHDYDIDAIQNESIDLDMFGEYGKHVRKELEKLGYFDDEYVEEDEVKEVIVKNNDDQIGDVVDRTYELTESLLNDLELSDSTEYLSEKNNPDLKSADSLQKSASYRSISDLSSINVKEIKEFVPNGAAGTNPFLSDKCEVYEPKTNKKKKNTNPFLSSGESSSEEELPEISGSASFKQYDHVRQWVSKSSLCTTVSSRPMSISDGSSDLEVYKPPTQPEKHPATSGFNAFYHHQVHQRHVQPFIPPTGMVSASLQYSFVNPFVRPTGPGFPGTSTMAMPPIGYGVPPMGAGGFFPTGPPIPPYRPAYPVMGHGQMPPPGFPCFPPMAMGNNPRPVWSNLDMSNNKQPDFYERYNQQLRQQANKKN